MAKNTTRKRNTARKGRNWTSEANTAAARRAMHRAVDSAYRHVVPTAATDSAEDRMSKAQREAAQRAAAAARRAEAERVERVRHNLACRRLPHAVTAVTAAAGTASWGVAELCELTGLPTLPVTVGSGVATLSAVALVHLAQREVITGRWRLRTWTTGTVSAVWVALASASGVTWVLLAGLLIAEVVLSRGWWQRHQLVVGATADRFAETVTAAPAVEVVDDSDVDRLLKAWSANVGRKGKSLPGATLTSPAVTEFAVEFECQLVRGVQNLKFAKSQIDNIASGLGCDPEDVILERLPRGEGAKKDSSRIKLTVVLRSPVEKVRLFTGPHVVDGAADIGLYADGAGCAEWQFWNSAGLRNGVLIGGTRSGKSGLTGVLATSARATGVLNTIYIDPQDGMSSPELAQRATVSILGEEQLPGAIRVVEALAKRRQRYGRQHRRSKLMPTAEMPGWVIFIDECDTLFGMPRQAELWKLFVKRCLKLGLCVIVATQYAGLTAFGGNPHLRAVLALNYIALKTQDKASGDLIPGMPRDPSELPDLPGFGYFGGKDRAGVPFRGDFLPADDEKLAAEPPLRLSAALDAFPEPEVCAMDREVLVRLLGEPDADGRWVCDSEDDPLAPLAAGEVAAAGDDWDALVPPGPPAPLRLVPDPPAEPAAVLGEYEHGVLAAMGKGLNRPKDIARATGWSRSNIHKVLAGLKDRKAVHQPKYGIWELGDGPNYDQQSREMTA